MTEMPSVVRYGFVAGGCLIAHNLILIVADHARLTLVEAAACSFCIMVVAGYVAVSRLAFQEPANWHGFSRYCIIMIANFPLSVVILWIASAALNHRMVLAAPVATAMTAGVNFLLARWAIATRKQAATPQTIGDSCAS